MGAYNLQSVTQYKCRYTRLTQQVNREHARTATHAWARKNNILATVITTTIDASYQAKGR